MKKILATILSLALLLSLASFAIADEVESPFEGVEVARDADGNVIDLGGMEIIVGDWWSSGEEAEPTTAQEEATAEWREWIQETYNFKVTRIAVADWGASPEFFTNFATTGGPENYAYILRFGAVAAPMNSGLFYDLATLSSLDFTKDKWNKTTLEVMTIGDSVYGMRPEVDEPAAGVFFNKRMLTEAGIDPESLYDMQADGTWTWEAFEEICDKLTRDTDNDGVVDVYALASFSPRLIGSAIASNGANFVERDEDGKYYNATGSDAFLEAANWIVEIIKKHELPQPEGSEWYYAEPSFYNGEAAMSVHQDYFASTLYENMQDDYGFVVFPKGPKADKYLNFRGDNVTVIPSIYDEQRAWNIAFAYDLYTNPTPGYDDEEDWKSHYYARYRDTRAVDDTIAILRDSNYAAISYVDLIPGYDLGPDFYWDVYGLTMTPAEKLESVQNQWQAYLDAVNGN